MRQAVDVGSAAPVCSERVQPALSAEREAVPLVASAPLTLRLASEDARTSLALVLELGSQALNGSKLAVKNVSAALAVAASRVCAVHEALRRVALAGPKRFAAVLAEHAARRATGDCQELARLMQTLQRVEQPSLVGHYVVVVALTLLSNLAADERWCASMEHDTDEQQLGAHRLGA